MITKTRYINYVKELPNIGIITFAGWLLEQKPNLGRYFTIDECIIELQKTHKNTMFWKGTSVKGKVEHFMLLPNPFIFSERCDIKTNLWRISRWPSQAKGLENQAFCLLIRAGNGRYKFAKLAEATLENKLSEAEKYVSETGANITI